VIYLSETDSLRRYSSVSKRLETQAPCRHHDKRNDG